MKKVLFTLTLVAFALMVNAQDGIKGKLILGGQFDLHHTNVHADDYAGGTSTTSFTLAPKAGWQLNDKMQFGLQIAYTIDYQRNYTTDEDNYTSTNSPAWGNQPTLTFAPYLRYNIGSLKKFTVFVEAQVALGLYLESYNYVSKPSTSTDNGDNYTQFGISVVPGLNYAVNNHLSVDVYLNLIRCFANFATADGWGGHEYGIGADMTAQSLNNQFNNFAIGFNYHF